MLQLICLATVSYRGPIKDKFGLLSAEEWAETANPGKYIGLHQSVLQSDLVDGLLDSTLKAGKVSRLPVI